MRVSLRLMRVLGGRVFWSFALVTFLMAALLASVNLASRFALKDYVSGQLERTPWDFTVFQTGGNDIRQSVAKTIRSVTGVESVEVLAILRARLLPSISEILVDNKPLQTPWLTLIAASESSLLPPQLQMLVDDDGSGGNAHRETRPILALVGPDNAMGEAFRALQGAKEFSVQVKSATAQRSVFTTQLDGVVRLDRDELSRWLMDQMGAPAYVPPIGAVLLMPYDPDVDANSLKEFDMLARGVVPADMLASESTTADERIHEQQAEYIPEVIYLARLNRSELISGWNIEESLARVVNLRSDVLRTLAPRGQRVVVPLDGTKTQENIASMKKSIFEDFFIRNAIASEKISQVKNAYNNSVPSLTKGKPGLIKVHDPGDPPDHHDNENVSGYFVDSTTQVLLLQMSEMARLIGIMTLLIAIPLLWMGWMLASNLSGLLMLNERRKLGLMRLRGVPGRKLGRTLLLSVSSGGFLGGIAGIVIGSLLLLMIYERGSLPLHVLLQPEQLVILVIFLLITVILSLLVSARLITYATTISPLEASGRFASSEAAITSVKFGVVQFSALVIGMIVLAGWVFSYSVIELIPSERIRSIAVVFDFLALPLFLYGVITLLGSRRTWIQALMSPFQKMLGGRVGLLTKRHMAAKPHRSVAFLMIIALMASISLYPTIGSKSFEDKAIRGARVQIGSDWHFTFNSPDLAGANNLRGALDTQLSAINPAMKEIAKLTSQVDGVDSVQFMIEAFLPSFYVPGAGIRGVPLYLLNETEIHKNNPYAEAELGLDDSFEAILQRVQDGGIAVSPAVAEFWEPEVGKQLRIGIDESKNTISVPAAGILVHLPGMPSRSVTNREGYVQSRVDYLNYLFEQAAYTLASIDNPHIQKLQVFIPRTILMVRVEESVLENPERAKKLQSDLAKVFPTTPLEMHTLPEEIKKVGSDMFVTLAIENMKIYIVGGILLAFIAIFAVALANYAEDRRTLALLRVRGTSPNLVQRFLSSILISPAIIGLVLGGVTALVAGYGLTNRVWEIREIRSVVQSLKTHFLISELSIAIVVFLLGLVFFAAWAIGVWTFRQSARDLH